MQRALRTRLIVEASVPVCVNPDDWTQAGGAPSTATEPFTPLQYVPLGTQRGILANLDDFSSGRTPTSRWVYVGLPFLGRLQDPADDGFANALICSSSIKRVPLTNRCPTCRSSR
jgi:hypothetical protein